MEYLQRLSDSILEHKDKNAFFIKDAYCTYTDLAIRISIIRDLITSLVPDEEKLIGLVSHDDLDTYAAIIALWFEGKAYVPLNPKFPLSRNQDILTRTQVSYVIDHSKVSEYKHYQTLNSKNKPEVSLNLSPKPSNETDLAYILFTSGSTGTPKGVSISFSNINAFIKELHHDTHFNLNNSDRCLQMFELTFDMSVVSYLTPLLYGACIYTIPENKIKYMYIYKLLLTQKLTVLITVPSIINYLRPYFNEINQPQVRLSCFAGGKLFHDVAQEWQQCIPNAQIINYYGPTETTIYCGYYLYAPPTKVKHKNNVVSIGKPFKNTSYCIIDENNNPVTNGTIGELAISGEQVSPGYWQNIVQNEKAFFTLTDTDNKPQNLYYKSGDLCYKDEDGDYLYIGRNDFQVKIQGYRIELGEIEHHLTPLLAPLNFLVLDIGDGNAVELYLIIESKPFDSNKAITKIKENLPFYMIPTEVRFIDEIPHNLNGKVDRNKLRTLFKK